MVAKKAKANPIKPGKGIPMIRGSMFVVLIIALATKRAARHMPMTRFLTA